MKFQRSLKYAIEGIRYCRKEGINFRTEMVIAIIAILLSALLNINAREWVAVIILIAAVLSLEMINTAIEQLCNLHTKEQNPSIKIIKDVSAGAVLLAATASVVCGGIIFIPKIYWAIKILIT